MTIPHGSIFPREFTFSSMCNPTQDATRCCSRVSSHGSPDSPGSQRILSGSQGSSEYDPELPFHNRIVEVLRLLLLENVTGFAVLDEVDAGDLVFVLDPEADRLLDGEPDDEGQDQ